jgi:hypothetical protein
MEKNKTGNYFKYAIGELQEEFNHNLIALERVMNTNTNNADNALTLSNHMGPGSPEITEKEFATLALNTTNMEVKYHPNQAVLDEIISSGKMAIFRNNDLKFALSSRNGTLIKVKLQEEEHAAVRIDVITIINEEGNSKKLVTDAAGNLFGLKESKFELGNLALLKSQKLENALVDFILTARYLNNGYYQGLKKEINLILELINKELPE